MITYPCGYMVDIEHCTYNVFFHNLYYLRQSMFQEMPQNVIKSGSLFKIGRTLRHWKKRWYVLSDNAFYYYNDESNVRPKGAIFINGALIEVVNDASNETNGYFGMEIMHRSTSGGLGDRRILYARSEEERESWMDELQLCTRVAPTLYSGFSRSLS